MTTISASEKRNLLESKLLDMAFGKVNHSVVSGLLLSFLIVAALWPVVAYERLLGWLAAMAAIQIGHFFYARRYSGRGSTTESGKWATGLVVGTAAAGLCWGSTVFCFPSSPFNPQTLLGVFILPSSPFDPVTVLLIFILAGVSAYACVAKAMLPQAVVAFLVGVWLPLAMWLFSFGEQLYVVMGLIALSYMGVMVMLSRQMHASVCELISVSEENRGLRTEQQQTDRRMAHFFESAPGFFYTARMTPDEKSSMPFVSAGIHELFDLAPVEVAESMAPLFALVRADDIEHVIKAREASRRNLSPFHIEFRINHRVKGERWIELHSLPQREPDGSTNWHGFMQDITGRKHLEDALVASEREFRTLAESFPDVVIRYDLDGRRTYVNRALAELAGAEPDEMLGKFLEDTPLLDPEAYMAELRKTIITRDASVLEVSARGADGEIFWYQARFVPEFDAGGNVSGVLMVAGDITERRRMEQELQRRETGFRTLAENLPVAVIRYDAEQRRRYINLAAERMLHGNVAALLGKVPGDGGVPATPAMIEHYRGKMNEVLATGEAREFDFSLDELPLDRQEHFEVRFTPERDEDGNVCGVLAIWFDITERKRLENEMRQQANFSQTLLDAINEVGMQLMVIEEGRITYASNRELSREFGYGEEEIAAGIPLMDIVHPDDRARVMDYHLRRVAGEASPNSYELGLVTKNGERREYETSVAVLPGTDSLRIIAVGKDITERKRMEEEFRLKEQVLDQAHDGVYLIDDNARFVYVNDQACRALGYSREELLGMGVADIDHSYSVDDSRAVGRKSREEGAFAFETQHRRRDGSLFPVEIQASALLYKGKHLGLAVARDISERKQAEAALEESNLLLRNVLQGIPDPVWMKDAEGAFVACNQGVARLFNMKAEEIIGKDDYDFFPPEQAEFYQNKDRAALEAGSVLVNEEWWTFADNGEQALMETRKTPVRSSEGRLLGVLGVARDITGRKAIEKALHDSERMLQEAQRIAHVGSWDVDMVNDRLTWSDEIFRIWEIDKTKFKADFAAFLETVHPEDQERVVRAYNDAVINHTLYEVEHRLLFPDGRVKHILERGEPQYDAEGKPVRFIGTSLDITERKQAQQRMELLERAIDFSADSVFLIDEQLRFRYVNETACRSLGYSREELLAMGPCDIDPGMPRELALEMMKNSPVGETVNFETRHRTKDGRSYPVELSGVHFEDGGEKLSLSVVRDISERKRAETELRDSRNFLDLILNGISDAIAVKDRQHRWVQMNDACCAMIGELREVLLGKSDYDFFPKEQADLFREKDELVFSSGEANVNEEILTSTNGEVRYIQTKKTPFKGADGQLLLVAASRDITEIKRVQMALQAREREFRSLAGNMPDNIARFDTEGRYLYVNPTHERLLGRKLEELVGQPIPDSHAHVKAGIAQVVATGQATHAVRQPVMVEGVEELHDVSLVPEFDETGKVVSVLGIGRDMTERYRMLEAIAAREQEFRNLAESSPDFIIRYDRAGRICYLNNVLLGMLGLSSAEEMIGKRPGEAWPDGRFDLIERTAAQVVESGVVMSIELLVPDSSGGQYVHHLLVAPEQDASGQIIGTIVFGRDITAIRATERKLAHFVDNLPGMAYTFRLSSDGAMGFTYVSPAIVEIFGRTEQEAMGDFHAVHAFVPAEDRERIEAAVAESARNLSPKFVEFRICRPGQPERWLDARSLPERQSDGSILWYGIMLDVTERKRMEAALAERQAFLDSLFEAIPVPVFYKDRAGRYLGFNRAYESVFGANREQLIGKSVFDTHPRELAETYHAKDEEVFERRVALQQYEYKITHANGTLRDVLFSKAAFTDAHGEVSGLIGAVIDITERKQMEEALRANEEKLSNLFELSPLGIALTDMQGRYVEFNEAFRRICGYPADELMTLDYWTLTPREYEAKEAEQLESLTKTGRYGPYEKEYRQKDGTLVPIQLNGVLVSGRDGQQYIWSIVEDITERKKTEAMLHERFERIVELNEHLEENARTLEEQTVELEASQEQLRHALEFSEGVINAIPDILFEMDREGRYHGIWTQQPELLAAQKALLLNKTMHEALPRETADAALAAIREADETGFSFGTVIDIALPSGEIRWFELSISRKQGRSPADSRFIVLSRDVTERQRSEEVLRFIAQGEWMRGGEAFPDALVRYLGKSLGVDYVVIDKVADEPGYVETVARYAKGEIVPNVRYALQSTPCGEVMTGVQCCHGENIQGLFPESGLLKDLQAESYVGIPLLDIEGAVIGLIAVLNEQPLSGSHFVKSILQMVAPSAAAELQRNRMEQVLRENYEALNEAQRISHVGNWELDLASGALLWSDEIYRIFEIDPERFGASYDAFINAIHPDDREAVNCAYSESLASREPYEIEHRLLFADGRIKYVHERCETRYTEDGRPVRSLGTVQDITERKQAEESLRESYDKIRVLNRHLEKNAVHLEENARYLEEQATELEASQEQLKQTEAWYRSILHSAPDGMLVVDDRGLIMQVNARLEAMFGYDGGELPGHRVEVLLPQVARDAHAGQRSAYFTSGATSRPAMVGKTLFGCRKDGSTFPVDVSLSRLPEMDGRRSAICASVRDITERQAMEAARETALAEAQRLAQLRSTFMAQMSHELRTPLNGILGYTQLLMSGEPLAEKQLAGLNIIQHSGEHLLSLINGLLDHAAIEADKFELIYGDIALDKFLGAIIGIIRVRAEQKNISFTCDAGSDLPAIVRGDEQRLRQVLINLLANAVKFTDSGSVILRVSHVEPSRMRFAVQDSGVGIAADQLENIFLPFEQIGETRRRAGGSGLGLAISRKLVRLMGGDILVESQVGVGSTFSFEIEMESVQTGVTKLDAAALSEQAVTRVAQISSMLPAPPRSELDILHGLALRGSMRDVMRHADRLASADERYQPFAGQLRQLTQSFQTKALLSLIEQYRDRGQEE